MNLNKLKDSSTPKSASSRIKKTCRSRSGKTAFIAYLRILRSSASVARTKEPKLPMSPSSSSKSLIKSIVSPPRKRKPTIKLSKVFYHISARMLSFFMNDEIYMNEALKIAANARGRTSPNPLVGAVIVKNNRIIAEGWHRQAGTPHAEINALNMAGDLAKDSTLYVTLEPCSHFGRTPPCANAIVNAGIKKVVIAMTDPNPKVAGRGIEILKNAGIEVEVGILEDQARRLNEVFIKWITTQKPFVTLKTAMSLDGKIATATGQSQWITSEESRRKVHELRDINDAIMIGIGTVLADNPSLTTRIDGGKNPIRIIVDSQLRTPINANVIVDGQAKTIIATTKNAPINKVDALKKSGVEIIFCGDDRKVDMNILMNELASREITSIFVEGGGTLNFSLLENHLVDKVFAFIAPKIIGGREALTSVEGDGFSDLNKAINLKNITTEMIGEDILISGIVCNDNF